MLRDRRNAGRGSVTLATLLLGVAGAALAPQTAAADQEHVVRIGQSLGLIAQRYGVTVAALAAANGMNPEGILRDGRVLRIPDGSFLVTAGQSLSTIARDYRVRIADLAAVNGLDREAKLQIGQRLRLPKDAATPQAAASPGGKANAAKTTAAKLPHPHKGSGVRADARKATDAQDVAAAAKLATKSEPRKSPRSVWGRPKHPGIVELYRLWSKESLRMRLVDARGRARQAARRALREFLRPRDSHRRKTPNARLLGLLARISDHFGGRPIHVISGYRIAKGLTRKTSRHVAGQAIDFRIPGVPLTELRDYCLRFPEVGVGYYPTTQFVHLDVRKQPARWTDWSLPGQPPVLSKPADNEEDGTHEPISSPRTHDETAERNSGVETSERGARPTG